MQKNRLPFLHLGTSAAGTWPYGYAPIPAKSIYKRSCRKQMSICRGNYGLDSHFEKIRIQMRQDKFLWNEKIRDKISWHPTQHRLVLQWKRQDVSAYAPSDQRPDQEALECARRLVQSRTPSGCIWPACRCSITCDNTSEERVEWKSQGRIHGSYGYHQSPCSTPAPFETQNRLLIKKNRVMKI